MADQGGVKNSSIPTADELRNLSSSQQKKRRLSTQRATDIPLDSLVGDIEEQQAANFAKTKNIPFVSLLKKFVPPGTLQLVSEEFVRENLLIPFYEGMGEIHFATPNPDLDDPKIISAAKSVAQEHRRTKIKLFFTSKSSFKSIFTQLLQIPTQERATDEFNLTRKDQESAQKKLESLRELKSKILSVPAIDILKLVVLGAEANKSSDIHIESEEDFVRIRYRIDGVLQEVVKLPAQIGKQFTTQVKIASKIEISGYKKPQDGRLKFEIDGKATDVRVSILPTQYGESIVMRLLSREGFSFDLAKIGFEQHDLDTVLREIRKPLGMIIITGPTGSGKTSTLYSILKKLNTPEVKIITLENPIEYHLDGIAQSQVDPENGYTFADGLRSILRQDPEMILVGETRDYETADTAIQAAMTGHLVLTTFHANDVPSTIPRLVQMGVKPFFIQISLNLLMSQRLVRKICPKCKEEYEPDEKEWKAVAHTLSKAPDWFKEEHDLQDLSKKRKLMHGMGCDACNGTGYKGRTGIFEVVGIDEELKDAITGAVGVNDVYAVLRKSGFVNMEQNGLKKAVVDKITTPVEVWSKIRS
jgi:type II secretory ATPase GspE/PulE/Tfp pilus assembly ATPase PilB-like protein